MAPLAMELVRRGHRVFLALRSVGNAEAVFAGTGVCYMQAPCFTESTGRMRPYPTTLTFAHLLANVGWDDDRVLFALLCSWRNLYALVRPDLVVFDHSPSALLASQALPMRRVLIGSGFCCPPDETPWPLLLPRARRRVDPARIADDERRLLDRANRLLSHWKLRPLDRLGSLYSRVDENFLTTVPELDHYTIRPPHGGRYWGPILSETPTGGAETPHWPAGVGPKIFAYLKRFDRLGDVLGELRHSGLPTLAYIDGVDASLRRRWESATMRLATRPLNLAQARRQCDLAVLHAGHGATAEMLLSGRPILQIPLVLEQRLTAMATAAIGAGLIATVGGGLADEFGHKLRALQSQPKYAGAAQSFAAKYGTLDARKQLLRMAERVEELLYDGTPAPSRKRTVFAG
jgi:hypothetical protein